MKIFNSTRILAAASLVAMGVAGTTPVTAETLRVAHSSNPGQSVYIYWEELANRVNERSGGELELKVFPSGQLGGDEQILRGMGSGTLHMGSNSSSNMGIVSDAYNWGDLPYVFKSADGAQAAFNDPIISAHVADKMRKDANTVVLGHIEVGGFRILINTQRPLRSPDDVQGMKFRMLSNPIDQALLSSWGGSPVPMPWSETFVSIEQGIANGLQLQPQAIAGFGYDKMIKYGTYTDTLMTVHVAQINAETWDGLSDEMKELMTTASSEALEVANSADRADAARFITELSETIDFYEPSEKEFEQWRSAAMGIWSQFSASIDPKILARVQAVQE
jgi:TRAP-type C4-dicarboxylate transport system substrate-binding protein